MEYKLVSDDEIIKMLELYSPYITDTTVSFEIEVPSLAEFKSRIQAISCDYPVVVCVEDGKLLGYGYAHRLQERAAYQWNAELSVYVDKQVQHKGIGKGLYQRLFALLRLQHVVRVYSIVTMPNEPSIGFHEAFGFTRCALLAHTGFKFGGWHDVVWMEKVIDEQSVPLPWISIDQVSETKISPILKGNFDVA